MLRNKKYALEYGIIGLGRFGLALAKTLSELGKEILAVDISESRVKQASHFTENAFLIGAYEKEVLMDYGIQNCATVIVCIGDSLDVNVLTTLDVIGLGVERVISRAGSYEQGMILEKIGAEVIYPENDMAVRLAHRLVYASIMDSIELKGNIAITELKLTSRVDGQTVLDINLRQKFKLNIIALEHDNEATTEIRPDFILHENDSLVVVGKRESIQQFELFLQGSEVRRG